MKQIVLFILLLCKTTINYAQETERFFQIGKTVQQLHQLHKEDDSFKCENIYVKDELFQVVSVKSLTKDYMYLVHNSAGVTNAHIIGDQNVILPLFDKFTKDKNMIKYNLDNKNQTIESTYLYRNGLNIIMISKTVKGTTKIHIEVKIEPIK